MRRLLWTQPWTAAFAILLGIILAPLASLTAHGVADLYDDAFPVATMRVASATKVPPDAVRLQFRVQRLRECDFQRLLGFSGPYGGSLTPADELRREDASPVVSYPPGTEYLSRAWIMRPVYGDRIVLHGYFDCDGRLVQNKLVDEVVR